MGKATIHVTTHGEFLEKSFRVLPSSECQKVFNGLSVFEMCAKVVNGTLSCNNHEGSPLGLTRFAIYLTPEFYNSLVSYSY